MNDQLNQPPQGASQLLVRTRIFCREQWGPTELTVTQSARYYLRATGCWRDAWIKCNANGYDRSYLEWAKSTLRCNTQGARWFTLVGAIDQATDSFFPIGDGSRWADGWQAPRTGKLYAFANDAPLMYWNNRGAITLEVWQ